MKSTNRKPAVFQKKGNSESDNIIRPMVLSLIGIFLCMVCLAGTTFAWFTASVDTRSTLTSANYDLEVEITDETGTAVTEANGSYALEAGEEYKVKLTASGTSKSGGYCIVNGDGKELKTAQIGKGANLSFTLIPSSGDLYKFIPVWGTYSGDADITDGATIGNKVTDSGGLGTSDKLHDDMISDVDKPHADGEEESKEQAKGEGLNTEPQQDITEELSPDISQ